MEGEVEVIRRRLGEVKRRKRNIFVVYNKIIGVR